MPNILEKNAGLFKSVYHHDLCAMVDTDSLWCATRHFACGRPLCRVPARGVLYDGSSFLLIHGPRLTIHHAPDAQAAQPRLNFRV